MELIERYLKAVGAQLPAAGREDILAELRDLLMSRVEEREADGVQVRVTSPAKSVADAFKFRSRLGLETAVDALKQALGARATTPAEIDRMARVCRVQAVVRPYLVALT